MTRSVLAAALTLLALAAAYPAQAGTGRLAELEVFDRATGQALPVHRHQGRLWVAGRPGHEYELRVRSRHGGRLLAVTSVDGVNVVTGQTAAPDQSGYVLAGHGQVRITGWRKSTRQTAAFEFTTLSDSYAARTGRPGHVGVIGVALFREAVPQRWQGDELAAGEADRHRARAPAAPSASAPPSAAESLGTGHGRRLDSPVRNVDFARATTQPDEVIEIRYDSRENLVAMGVLPAPWRHDRQPRAFPAGFVPDP
ncbi:MAG: hypothetical protein KF823_08490 [Xanthomonadales bacterium]|nr:hypothetical protein [Xanthomonadales bacterium]